MNIRSIMLLLLAWALSMGVQAQGQTPFTLGADISWSTELEDAGYTFVTSTGKECSCPELVKTVGITAVRLRVWVNPEKGYNGKDDVLAKAKAAHEHGLDLMIDFHFSDTWADPEHQTVPAAWNGHNLIKLCGDVNTHVQDILNALKDEGIEPRWVQIGNETSDGLLWDVGKASSNASNYKTIMAKGYDAVKAVFPDAKVIVHLPNAHDQGLYDWNLALLNKNKFDIIGMSLYPDSNTDIEKAVANIKHQWEKFGKECMIVEVGVKVSSPTSARLMRTALDQLINQTDNHCLGAFYWEPESFNGWNGGYERGASLLTGTRIKFGPIMNAFKEVAEATGIQETKAAEPQTREGVFTLSGTPATKGQGGILVQDGKKVLHRRSR